VTTCFLFFRFWPGFTDSFPVNQFNGPTDEELPAAPESFTKTKPSKTLLPLVKVHFLKPAEE
jgi:hypothetical protein